MFRREFQKYFQRMMISVIPERWTPRLDMLVNQPETLMLEKLDMEQQFQTLEQFRRILTISWKMTTLGKNVRTTDTSVILEGWTPRLDLLDNQP